MKLAEPYNPDAHAAKIAEARRVELGCGCAMCDLNFAPFKAEGIFWHQVNGREPFRCTRKS